MRPLQILVLFLGLSLCLLWTDLTWPGYYSGPNWYSYPVTPALVGFEAMAWAVVLVPTILLVRKIRRK